ncbi:hypothetical protein QFC20_007150 [Naganishia adeliensis]|uniref:Uncharacterized protein n=1 Tax=Naganishia adeliensis TaxID=92952 RepID=A0ACC2V2T9_9TREE|nr:hypothetical protein QFC20_007150 [Naganishia adeliensis]
MFMRAHPNHLIPTPSESRAHHCAKYFPGIDMRLMHDWWVYVDEGGSIGAEDVAFAIQYAVMYHAGGESGRLDDNQRGTPRDISSASSNAHGINIASCYWTFGTACPSVESIHDNVLHAIPRRPDSYHRAHQSLSPHHHHANASPHYRFLKYVDHLQSRQEAREYIIYGVTAEAEYINSHKGTYPETEKESYDIALTALLEAFDQSSAYAAYSYDSMTSSFSSYYSVS